MKKYGKGFPRYTLRGTVKVIEEAAKHGKFFGKEAFAAFGIKTGTSSPTSGAYLMRLGAMRDFGLIEQTKEEISLTDLALKIAHPKSSEEKQRSIKEAFLNSEIFSALYNSSAKNTGLGIEAIGNMAVRQNNVNPKHKKDFLRNLIASGEYAGLISKVDKHTIQFVSFELTHEKDLAEPDSQKERDVLDKKQKQERNINPVVNQIWGNDTYKIQLLIHCKRPLTSGDFSSIGKITTEIENLANSLEQGNA